MAAKEWYEVWGQGPGHDAPVLLAKVRSPGLANYTARAYREFGYINVFVR